MDGDVLIAKDLSHDMTLSSQGWSWSSPDLPGLPSPGSQVATHPSPKLTAKITATDMCVEQYSMPKTCQKPFCFYVCMFVCLFVCFELYQELRAEHYAMPRRRTEEMSSRPSVRCDVKCLWTRTRKQIPSSSECFVADSPSINIRSRADDKLSLVAISVPA